MSKVEKARCTPAEYLATDRQSNEKYEYAFGEIFAMTGASLRHVGIAGNIAGELRTQLRQGPCRVYSMDLRVCVDRNYRYTYPDVVVCCAEPQLLDDALDTLLNPELIVEVLSESTRNYDRGDKFQQYRGIPSFREYLLVDQERVHVERYSKQSDGTWSLWETDAIDGMVQLDSVGARLSVAEIYFKIDFSGS